MKKTKECIKCNNCELYESNKANIKIICHLTGKVYTYGQIIPCNVKINNTKGE